MSDSVIFGLAFAAYVVLGGGVMLSAWGRPARLLTVAAAVTASTHVALVWGFRFEGSLSAATEKGLAGFIVFHVALATLLAASLTPQPASRWLSWLAFAIVTAGAVGAAFKYDYVAGYRIPLLVVAFAVMIFACLGWRHQRTHVPSP